jgi:putative FmdB family regulatory protein
MPLYEYHCEPCGYTFEALIRSMGDVAVCPRCSGDDVIRQLSIPAAAQTGRGRRADLPIHNCANDSPAFGCGRPQCGSGQCAGLG